MDLYFEVQKFYARQLPLLEQRQVEEFAGTYTADGVFEHASGRFKLEGREQIAGGTRASLEHYGDKAFRHWTNHLQVEQVENAVHTSFVAIVSVTDADGRVTWEPSCRVKDVLVRQNARLLVHSRVLQHDVADMSRVWAGQLEGSS